MSTQCIRMLVLSFFAITLYGCGTNADRDSMTSPIQLEPLVSFEDADGSTALWRFPVPSAKTSDGLYLISDDASNGVIPVFDSTGTYVRSIGREGSGPGEYRRVSRVLVLDNDSILVIDDQLRRATILGSDLSYVRSFQLPLVPYDMVQIGRNSLAATSAIPRPDSSFGIIDLEGNLLVAFSSNTTQGGPPLPHMLAADEGGFWSFPVAGGVELTRWDSLGSKVGTVALASDWMTSARGGPVTPESPPASQVRGIWTSGDGHLWILASVADPEWAEGLGESKAGEGGATTFEINDRDAVFDSVIEVVDSQTGMVLDSHRFDEEYRFVPFPGVVARLIESIDGLRLELFRVSYSPPQ